MGQENPGQVSLLWAMGRLAGGPDEVLAGPGRPLCWWGSWCSTDGISRCHSNFLFVLQVFDYNLVMHRNVTPDPSPLEIHQACENIRKGWSEKVHQQRSGLVDDRQEWTIPVYLAISTSDGVKYVREDAAHGVSSDASDVCDT